MDHQNKPAKKRTKADILITTVTIIAILVGVGLLLYPTVSDWWNQQHRSHAIAGYTESVEGMTAEDYAQYRDAAREYNEYLQTCVGRFTPTEEESSWYRSLLNITDDGIMAYIEIPKIDVKLPIYHSVDSAVLQVAIGHLEGSSLPIGGPGTHAVLSGHRGLSSAKLFTHLDELEIGDEFFITVLGETLHYIIDNIDTVLPEEMDGLAIEEGKDYCTLVTCTPYGVNTHRLLVRGARAD